MPAHQSAQKRSELVPSPGHTPALYVPPLLPFERELISLLGCSEAEYRTFKREVELRGRERPADYAQVPDVQATGFELFLINLAVGIALSAVSALLAPKPQQPPDIKQRQLQNKNGRTRFNQTYGFEGGLDLAEFGARIPIPFGRYQIKPGGPATGGLVVEPLLVWSRMLSYGRSQGYRAALVVGERGLTPPSVEGIYIGNNALSANFKESYAVYWSNQDGMNRIKQQHLIAGVHDYPGDLEDHLYDEVFLCPTVDGMYDTGFCAVHTPSNTTQFGVYSPIHNGTALKLNWRVVSILDASKWDEEKRNRAERRKIAGSQANKPEWGMRGTGRGWSPFMGLTAHNGTSYELPTMVGIAVGDTVTFTITDKKHDDISKDEIDPDTGVDYDDVEKWTDTLREAADDQLQMGELFLIGRCVFQLVQRPPEPWRPKKKLGTWNYQLKCTELLGHNVIGIAGTKAVHEYNCYNGLDYKPWWTGPNFFPLLRFSAATVRNLRPVETTEIGIRSRVFQQANGLCNLSAVPAPAKLIRFDQDNVQLTTGYRTAYFQRASAFTLYLRPAGLQEDGSEYSWEPIGEQFVVIGAQPVDQFGMIRIKGERARQMEFRLVPKCGADIRNFSPESEIFWRMNATSGTWLGRDCQTKYGTFRLTTIGEQIPVGEFLRCREMRTKGKPAGSGTHISGPTALEHFDWTPSWVTKGRKGGYLTTLLGLPTDHKGQARSTSVTVTVATGKTITLTIGATSIHAPLTNSYYNGWGWEYMWATITNATGKWSQGDTFDHVVTANNDFFRGEVGARYRITLMGMIWVPGDPAEEERWFEERTMIADLSHFEEINKSCESDPDHEIVYVNESTEEENGPANYFNLTMMGMALRSSGNFKSIDQVRAWIPNGVQATRFGWSKTVGPANKFSDLVYYLLTDQVAGIGKRMDPALIDEAGFYRTSKFLINYEIFWDGVLEEQVNLRQFFAQYGPLSMVNFTIKNGRFTCEPALPTDDNGVIIDKVLPIAQIFTAGNIIDGSFTIDYLDREERMSVRGSVQWREGEKNKLPQQRIAMLQWADERPGSPDRHDDFDMSLFCTSRKQALMVGRYLMSIKRRVDHVVKFQTTPEGLGVAPGQYIRVITQASPYSLYRNGVVLSDGTVRALDAIEDGQRDVHLFRKGADQLEEATITITNGRVDDPQLFDALFSLRFTTVNQGVYQIEEVGLNEDGLVEITASAHPTDSTGASLIVRDVLNESLFTVVE